MKKLPFFTAIIICIWTNFGLNTDYALAKQTNNQIKLVKLDNLNNSSLEVFLNDEDLIQNIATKNAELNLSFDASSLINNSLLPTSFKIEIYDVTTDKRLLGIFRPSVFNQKQLTNFKTNIELTNLTKSSNLEINIYNTKNRFFANYHASIVIENQSGISFTELEAANCTGEFGKCQLEYIFQNIHFTTLPSKGLKTKIEQNTDGTYSVNLPLIRGKKYIKVKNIFGSSNDDSDNQDFSFDFDGANLFVVKDGVTTQVAAQGPAGEKGDSGAAGPKGDNGATGPKGDTGAPGGFTGGDIDINGTLTFVANGKLQDAVLNGLSLAMTNNAAQVPLTVQGAVAQTANLQEWQNSTGAVLGSITSTGHLSLFPTATAAERVTITKDGLFSYINASIFTANTGGGVYGWSMHNRNLGPNGLQLLSTDTFRFTNNTTFGTADTGLARNAAGILEVNNGTSGQWAALRVGSRAAATQPLIVRAAAAQTANLQEWQNSAGASLLSIGSLGQVIIPSTWDEVTDYPTGGMLFSNTGGVGNDTVIARDGSNNLVYNVAGGGPSHKFKIGGTTVFELTNAGVSLNNIAFSGTAAYNGTPTGTVFSDVGGTANDVGIWRDTDNYGINYKSGHASLANHNFYFGDTLALKLAVDPSLATANLIIPNSVKKGLTIRAAAAQTANLQEWQNNAGTVLTSISPTGGLENISSIAGWGTSAAFTNNSATAFSGQRIEFYHHHLGVKTASGFIGARGWVNGGQHGELVLGVAGNGVLYQGATLDVNGLFRAPTLRANIEISANNVGMNYALNGPSITHGLWAADHLDMGFKWGGLTRMIGSWQGRLGLGFTNRTGINSLFHVKATGAAIPTVIVQSISAQTANLQEWQNANGTTLTTVDASGNITLGPTGSASGVKLIGGYSAGNYLDLNAASPSLASGATAWPLRFITALSGFRFNSSGNAIDLIPIGSNTLAFYVPTTSTSSQNSTAPTGTLATLQAGSINIADTIKLTARATPPSSPNLGDLYVDSDSNELCFYDGSSWTGIKAGGACS